VSIIYGERIRLRAVEQEDVKKFFEWVNDPEVTHGLTLYLPMSMTDEERWFEQASTRAPDEKPFAIDVRAGDGWRLIGNCTFFDMDTVAHSAEIGIMIGEKSVWNQGLGTETISLLLRHGFETLNLNRISLKVYSDNPRARRTYEKVGFIHEGSLRQAVYKRGRFGNVELMSVLRSEWEAHRKENR
jgi:diamine N-acetyltransferase